MIMQEQDSLQNNKWKDQDEFKDEVSTLNNYCEDIKQELQETKVKFFIETIIKILNNHFQKWGTDQFWSIDSL